MDKVWLVTGASRGLGRELAKAVVAAGDRLVATARDPRALHDVVALRPERTLAVALDVTKAEDARRAVAAAVERFGRIDALVNNAGYANTQSIEDVDEADFRAQ
jgi:NAD(P)-dependent dehydrogenase (short-subunit alcohol dehydrogenase family)